MASPVAARLQDLLHGFATTSADHGVKKLVPDSCGAGANTAYNTVMDAAEVLESLPCFAAHLASLPFYGVSGSAGPSHTGHGPAVLSRPALTSLILFVGGVVERHVQCFKVDASEGPRTLSMTRDGTVSMLADSCSPRAGSSGDLESRDEEEGGRGVSAHTQSSETAEDDPTYSSGSSSFMSSSSGGGGGGGPRANFVAWVALEVYRHLAKEAEERQRGRRAAGGASVADAGVRSDAFLRWEGALRLRLEAALSGWAQIDGGDGVGGGDAAARHEGVSEALRSAAETYVADTGDVFTSKPHFFSTLVRTQLLPYVRQALERRAVFAAAGPAAPGSVEARARWWVRSLPTPPPCTASGDGSSRVPQLYQTSSPSVGHTRLVERWRDFLCLVVGGGGAALPLLTGAPLYEPSGLLRPCTPADTAASLAAAAMAALCPGILGTVTRWLDTEMSVAAAEVRGGRGRVSTTRNDDDVDDGLGTAEGAAAAVRHALELCTGSLQVVPCPLGDGRDADLRSDTQMAGGWLLASESSVSSASSTSPPSSLRVSVRDVYGRGVSMQRRLVVLPGLSIAATRVSSASPVTFSGAHSERSAATAAPDVGTPAGTCVVAPAEALAQLLLGDVELDAAALTTTPCDPPSSSSSSPPSLSPCGASSVTGGAATDADDRFHTATTVSAVPPSHLRVAEWLLLFSSLPVDLLTLERLRVAVVDSVDRGWVLVVVQAAVPKAVQSLIEATWGSVARPVLLLSAVGHWGLQQLAMRFDVEPNSPFTDPGRLRGVRRRGSGAVCGVAVLLMRSQTVTPSFAVSSTETGREGRRTAPYQHRQQQHPHRHHHSPPLEVREHVLCVLGHMKDAAAAAAQSIPSSAPPSPPLSPGEEAHPQSPSAAVPMSMFHHSDSSSSDDETAESCSTHSSNGGCSRHGSAVLSAEKDDCAGSRVCRWYGNADLPLFPCVTHSVLIGAATRAGQHEAVYFFWYWWRQLLHRLVLPPELGTVVDRCGPLSANVQAICCLDALVVKAGSERGVAAVCDPSELHLLQTLRAALWSYAILAQQHEQQRQLQGEACSHPDEGWRAVQRWLNAAGGESTSTTQLNSTSPTATPQLSVPCTASESWLEICSAYVALAACLDELCATVVVSADGGEWESGPGSSTGLRFLSMV